MDTLDLTFTIEHGEKGIDDDPYNPLSRSLNTLLQAGKPFKRLTQCFFQSETDGNGNKLRWFGIFIHSQGNRILFFPGFSDTYHEIVGFRCNSTQWKQAFTFDHISLEKDLRKYHITDFNSNNHLGNTNTYPLGENRYFWFSLNISSINALRILKEKTKVNVKIHPNDSMRRTEVALQSREGSIFQILKLNPDSMITDDTFMHFEVIIGPNGFSNYKDKILGYPHSSVREQPLTADANTRVPTRIHKIALSDQYDIQIATKTFKGKLNFPVLITT